jgi:hypothetical protein
MARYRRRAGSLHQALPGARRWNWPWPCAPKGEGDAVHRDREEGALQGTDGASVSEGISSRGRWGTPVCGGQGRRVACCRSISSFAEQHSRESRPGRGPSAGRSRARDGGCLGVGGRGWNLLQVQGGSATPVFGGQGRRVACRSRPRAECRRATRRLWCGLCIAGPCEVSRNRELPVDDAALPLVDHAAVQLQPGDSSCESSTRRRQDLDPLHEWIRIGWVGRLG